MFVKLSEEKYVRIIDRYQPIASDLIERYMNKDVRHLYVKINDFKLLTNQLLKRLSLENNSSSLTTYEKSRSLMASPPTSAIFPIQLQETVYESISKIGVNEKSVEMASMAISSTLEIIEQDKVSFENLSKFLKKGDYLSSHSFFLAFLSCAILRESQWKSPMNSNRLTLASFFHDLGLGDSELAKIHDLEKYDFDEMEYSDVNKIKEHTLQSVKIMQKIEGIPNDVDKIVLQHHETYDGTGYPRKIDFKHFSPLSAIFRVAHILSDRLYVQGMEKYVIDSVIEEIKSEYKSSPFNIIISSLEKCFSQSKQKAS